MFSFCVNCPIIYYDPYGHDYMWTPPSNVNALPTQVSSDKCPCKCQYVNVFRGPSPGLYPFGKDSKYGFLMTITWTVSGDPQKCKYGQLESGTGTAIALSGQPEKLAETYRFHLDLKSEGLPFTYGINSATYRDAMGTTLRHPTDDGDWKISPNLSIKFICTSSDGELTIGGSVAFDYENTIQF